MEIQSIIVETVTGLGIKLLLAIAASFVSFALTTQLTVIPTQRPRFEVDLPGVSCPKLLYFKPGN